MINMQRPACCSTFWDLKTVAIIDLRPHWFNRKIVKVYVSAMLFLRPELRQLTALFSTNTIKISSEKSPKSSSLRRVIFRVNSQYLPTRQIPSGWEDFSGLLTSWEFVCDLSLVCVYSHFHGPWSISPILWTFRGKMGFGFDRQSTVEVGSEFFGRFEIREWRRNHFHDFMHIPVICTKFCNLPFVMII